MSSLPARIKKIQLKYRCYSVHKIPPIKILCFFPDAQGHLTLQSMVGSGQISNTFSGAQGQITPKSVGESCRNSKSFKFSCMCLLPARMKKVQSKMISLEWPQHFFHYKSMGSFPFAQGQLTPQTLVRSAPNSNSVRDFMVVIVTRKNEEDPIEYGGARVATIYGFLALNGR